MKYKLEQESVLFVEYEYDIQPGDVFKDPMKGWELHVKATLDDQNLLIWNEYASKSIDRELPLESKTDNLEIRKSQDLIKYYWGPLRGGKYIRNEHGTFETVDATWVPPKYPLSVRLGYSGIPDYHSKDKAEKPSLMHLGPLDEIVNELAKPWSK